MPDQVRQFMSSMSARLKVDDDHDDELIGKVREVLDTSEMIELGEGDQFVYAYGYRCAPDRLKIGSYMGDVFARVAAQIGTGTPDRPTLFLAIKTHDCRALERALHGIFRLKGKHVSGAGVEWFRTTRDEVANMYGKIVV